MSSLVEQIALVAADAQAEVRTVLMLVCLAGLSAILLPVLALYAAKWTGVYLERLRSRGRLSAAFGILATLALAVYAGTKHAWQFEYANGLHDNGSYCTNDEIRASWTYDAAAMEYTVKAVYQDISVEDDDLHPLPECPVRDGSHVWIVPNATNLRVIVYATYVRPPAVHTNGVYRLSGVMRTMDDSDKYVTPGVQIRFGFDTGEPELLAPPDAPASLLEMLSAETLNEENEQ